MSTSDSSDSSELKKDKLKAKVCCPYCPKKTINVFHKPTKKNYFLWNTSNYPRHLKLFHTSNDDIHTIKKNVNERLEQTKNGENSFTTSSTLTSTMKVLKDKNNSQGNNLISSISIQSKSGDALTLKCNSPVNDLVTSCTTTSQPKSCVEKQLVCYTDTSEDEDHYDNELNGKLVLK